MWWLAGPPPKQVGAADPGMIAACAARLEAVTSLALRALPGSPAAYLNPGPDPGPDPGSCPGAAVLQQGPALARLAHAHADGAMLGTAAALLRLHCEQSARDRIRGRAADMGAPDPAAAAQAEAAEAADSARAAGLGSGVPVRAARGGGAAAEPDQAQGAGPLLGALGANLRRAAAFLSSGSAAGSEPRHSTTAAAGNPGGRSGSAPGLAPAPEPGLPLAAAHRAVALLEAGGRALGCFRFNGHDLGLGAAEGFACAAAKTEPAAEADSPQRAAFDALLALHLRLLRSLVPAPEVPPQAQYHTRRCSCPRLHSCVVDAVLAPAFNFKLFCAPFAQIFVGMVTVPGGGHRACVRAEGQLCCAGAAAQPPRRRAGDGPAHVGRHSQKPCAHAPRRGPAARPAVLRVRAAGRRARCYRGRAVRGAAACAGRRAKPPCSAPGAGGAAACAACGLLASLHEETPEVSAAVFPWEPAAEPATAFQAVLGAPQDSTSGFRISTLKSPFLTVQQTRFEGGP